MFKVMILFVPGNTLFSPSLVESVAAGEALFSREFGGLPDQYRLSGVVPADPADLVEDE